MSYNHVEIKKFPGLYLNRNSFEVPDGAAEQLDNCVINRPDIIDKRRGFYTFLTPAGGKTLNNLYNYQSTLIAVYTNQLQYVDSGGTGHTASGDTVAASSRTARFVESNSNLYITSNNGVLKLEAYNSNVFKSGVAPGLDLRGKFNKANGPIGSFTLSSHAVVGDCQVNYRVVFGRLDANNNLLLGAPSDILTLTNRVITGQTYTRSSTTVTVATSSPHNLATGMTLTIGHATDTGIETAAVVITVTSSTGFTFTTSGSGGNGTLDYGANRTANIEFTIPSEVTTTSYFYQIYRSSQSGNADTTAPLDFKLIQQVNLTSAQITAEVVFFTDNVDNLFLGEELYTNPNSQEGELQANDRAPLCDDVAFFRNFVFYAATTSRHLLPLSLVSTASLSSADYVEIKVDSTTRRYVGVTGVGNSTVPASSLSGTNTVTVTYNAHGFSDGYTIYVSNADGSFAAGVYTIGTVMTNSFVITGTGTPTALDFQGVSDGTYPIFQIVAPGSSVATGLDQTARALVKAINRDILGVVYARYTSLADQTPGQFYLQAKGFGGAINARASATSVGGSFSPTLPTSFDGSVVSSNDVLPNSLSYSKVGEPEAVPLSNTLSIGSRNKAILRIFALRDSLMVIKEDGVFRLDGSDPSTFSATIVDSTIFCLVADSAGVINNQVVFLSNQGVVMASNSSVQIISYKIEDQLSPIYGYSTLVSKTSAVTYESSRLYLLSTLLPNTTDTSVVYCYNTLTDAWTTWDTFFGGGAVGPNDTLYLLSSTNKLMKERKNQDRTDFCGESFSFSVNSVASNKLSAVITSSAYVPQVGDALIANSLISSIASAIPFTTNEYTVKFDVPTTLAASDTGFIYQSILSTIRFSPYHAGQTNRMKQFSQFQVHSRNDNMSVVDISFINDVFGGSEVTNWKRSNVASASGWGLFPWGFEPFGQSSGIKNIYTSAPNRSIRIYIPLFSQRCAYIQPILSHKIAGEQMAIQAIGYSLRGYGERTTL